MRRLKTVGLLGLVASLALSVGLWSPRGLAQTPISQTPTVQLPTLPDPVAVQLDSSKTAFLVLDLVDRICTPEPSCVALLPNVAAGLKAARAANVLVIYTTSRAAPILPEVAPAPGDPVIDAHADKFQDSNLAEILKAAGITTTVITGSSLKGAVLYTSFAAAERGYTVVAASDGIVGGSDFVDLYGRYQLLNMSGFTNPQNIPLQPNAVTLSRTDLISYK